MPRALSLAMSGTGIADFTLEELREMISDYGFSRDDVDEDAPQWRRADVDRFLELYHCSSFAAFKARFAAEKLLNPSKLTPEAVKPRLSKGKLPQEPSVPKFRVSETRPVQDLEPAQKIDCTMPERSQFDELSATWRDLRWRRVQRSPGVYTPTDDWLRLYAAEKQARILHAGQQAIWGDCPPGDRPQADPDSGVDAVARARHEAWAALRGMSHEEAVSKFLRVYGEAATPGRAWVNFRAGAIGVPKA